MLDSTVKVDNSGYGYAQGVELFWRDKKSIKNADYWVSYSYIDTRRLYQNFPVEATPTFIAKNTLSIVGKYFVEKWTTNFSATYSYTSGLPYYNPEQATDKQHFLKDYAKPTSNLALTVAYLHSFGRWFTVFYLSIDNILDTRNVYGYNYKYYNYNQVVPGSKTAVVPALYRTVFFGINASLTKFSKDEL